MGAMIAEYVVIDGLDGGARLTVRSDRFGPYPVEVRFADREENNYYVLTLEEAQRLSWALSEAALDVKEMHSDYA